MVGRGRAVLDQRKREQDERIAVRAAREEAGARLDGIQERIGAVTIEQVDEAEQDLDQAWAGWTPRSSALRQQLAGRRQQLAVTGDWVADGDLEPGAREQ